MTPRQKSFIYMSASILLSTLAQLSMKVGMLQLAHDTRHGWPGVLVLLGSHSILWVGFGLTCYAISLLFWMAAIARLELSLAYPMLSLSYVLVYIVAVNWPILHEHASWIRTLGILVVILGVVLIARSDTTNRDPHHETR